MDLARVGVRVRVRVGVGAGVGVGVRVRVRVRVSPVDQQECRSSHLNTDPCKDHLMEVRT